MPCLRARLAAAEASRSFKERAAEALADEVAVLVERKAIDSRSPAADALLDYRDPPRSVRADRIATLEGKLAAAEARAAQAHNDALEEAARIADRIAREAQDRLARMGGRADSAQIFAPKQARCPGCERTAILAEQTTPDGDLATVCHFCSEHLKRTGETSCLCDGCTTMIPAWWLSGMCGPCAHEDCEHDEGPDCQGGVHVGTCRHASAGHEVTPTAPAGDRRQEEREHLAKIRAGAQANIDAALAELAASREGDGNE